MRVASFWWSAVVIGWAFVPTTNAGIIVSLNNEGSTTLHEVTTSPGGTFSVDVNLADNRAPFELSMRLSASSSDIFSIGAASFHSPIDSWTSILPSGNLNPVTNVFGFLGPFGTSVDLGHPTIATVQFLVDVNAPVSSYTLNVSDVFYRTSPVIPESDPGTPGADFSVSIVPEPASFTLLMVSARS